MSDGRQEDVQLGVLVLVERQRLAELAAEHVRHRLAGELHEPADRGLLAVGLAGKRPGVLPDECPVHGVEGLLVQVRARELDGLQRVDVAVADAEDLLVVAVALPDRGAAAQKRLGRGLGLLPLEEAHVLRQLLDVHLVLLAQKREVLAVALLDGGRDSARRAT